MEDRNKTKIEKRKARVISLFMDEEDREAFGFSDDALDFIV